MNANQTDVVGAYLHEVDLRLSGLPLLQRRELLADLAAHIATERTDRNVSTEGELIEILERLGSPEVVASAAYEEAGAAKPAPVARTRRSGRAWWIAAAVLGVVLLGSILLCAAFMLARDTVETPQPAAGMEQMGTPDQPVDR